MSTVSWDTPKYEYRGNGKREIHFQDGERLSLTIDKSTIPNSGRGLFLTYLGNSKDTDEKDGNAKKWTPSNIVDLGMYIWLF